MSASYPLLPLEFCGRIDERVANGHVTETMTMACSPMSKRPSSTTRHLVDPKTVR